MTWDLNEEEEEKEKLGRIWGRGRRSRGGCLRKGGIKRTRKWRRRRRRGLTVCWRWWCRRGGRSSDGHEGQEEDKE